MSGHFRVFVVDARTGENVRVADFEVPEHPAPIALGVGPHGNTAPQTVHDAAAQLLKAGESIDQIVHLSEGAPA